jgi:hypothetical protein
VQEPEVTPKQKRYTEAFSGPAIRFHIPLFKLITPTGSSRIDRHEIELGKAIGKGQFGEVYIGNCRGMEVREVDDRV